MQYSIKLEPSGHLLHVAPGQTVLDAAIGAGVRIPYSCKNGMCRTCKGRVVFGEVERAGIQPEYLSPAEVAAGMTLLCRTVPRSDCTIQVEELPDTLDVPQKYPVRVTDVSLAAPDVAVLRLRLPMNKKLRLRAGQYVDLLLDNGCRRSYSVASRPELDGLSEVELHIRHLPGGLFTDRVFGGLKKSTMLQIEAPLGTFILKDDCDRPIVFLASGTGFAPIQAMVEDAMARGLLAGRQALVFWGGRKRADLYRLERARQWAAQLDNLSFHPVLSEPLESDRWDGKTGFVHQAVMSEIPDLSNWRVYACGAPLMVDAARRDFVKLCGLREECFHADSFLTQADLGGPGTAAPVTP